MLQLLWSANVCDYRKETNQAETMASTYERWLVLSVSRCNSLGRAARKSLRQLADPAAQAAPFLHTGIPVAMHRPNSICQSSRFTLAKASHCD